MLPKNFRMPKSRAILSSENFATAQKIQNAQKLGKFSFSFFLVYGLLCELGIGCISSISLFVNNKGFLMLPKCVDAKTMTFI